MGNSVAVFAALLLLLFVPLSLWLRLRSWTLLDLFLLSITMFFGAYTVIDALAADTEHTDALAAAYAFLPILVGAFILWAVAKHPWRTMQRTSLERLRADWVACPAWPVIGLFALSIAYRWYTAVFFADLGVVQGADIESIERDLPYWYTSLAMLATESIYAAGLCAWGKMRVSKGLRRLFWLALVGLAAVVILGIGRRAIFAFMVVLGWELVSHARSQGRQLRALVLIAAVFPLLLTLSNLYQAYRFASYRGVVVENIVGDGTPESLFESAAEVDRTVSNLKERTATWRYNYEVTYAHIYDDRNLMWGALFFGGFPNFIPSAIYPDKVIFDTELETLRHYGLDIYDRSENLFVSTYADFGLLSMLISPGITLGLVWLCGFALRMMRDPFLRVLLMGMAAFYALNIEASYHVPIGIARDFIFMAMAYLLIRGTARSVRSLVVYGSRPQH